MLITLTRMEKRFKVYGSIFLTGIALIGTVLGTREIQNGGFFERVRATNEYQLDLTKDNAFKSTGSGTQNIYTKKGNTVPFSYTNCAPLSGGHVKINEGGTIANDLQITHVTSVLANFTGSTASTELQFRASNNKENWGEWGSLVSGNSRDFASEPYYFEFKALNGAVNLTSITFEYTCLEDVQVPTQFIKVEDALDDYSGEYLIVYEDASVAFNGSLETFDVVKNNFKVSITDKQIPYTDDTHAKSFDFEKTDGGYSIKSRSGFYIGGKSKSISSSETYNTNYDHSIKIYDDGDAELISNDFNLRFNSASDQMRFRYYSNSSSYITIYKANAGGSSSTIPEYEALLQITDNNENYAYGHSFNETFGTENFSSSVLMSGGTETAVNPNDLTIDIEKSGTHYAPNVALNSEGTYNVTISYGTLAPVKYQINVTKIAVSSVTFDKNSLRLKPTDTYTLSATVLPESAFDKSMTWTSSNSSVATVSASGTITAVSDGTTTIKATANNGVNAECSVTVSSQAAHSGTSADDPFTVSEALAYYNDGGKVTTGAVYITGVVTSNPSSPTVSSGRGRLYITDGNQTLYIYNINDLANTNNVTSNLIKVGNTLVVTGAIKDYQGTPQLAYVNGVVNCYIISSTEQLIPVNGITISPTSTDVSVNNTVTLTATIAPSNASNKGIVWSSSNSNVASVDQNGVVTGHIVGQSATIYAKSAENSSISASCTVNVKAIAVQSVSLNQETATVAIGDELTLIHTISPETATNQNVTWSSSDQTVATVSNGVVSALAEGETTITVKTDDGDHTGSCLVTVLKESDDSGDSYQGTITISDYAVVSFTTKDGKLTLTSDGTNASTAPAYNTTGEDLRLYANSTLKVESNGLTMTSLVFHISTQGLKRWATITASEGTLSVDKTNGLLTWTGSSKEITFTVGTSATYGTDGSSKAGQLDFTAIDVVCSGGGTPTPEPTLESIKVDSSTHRTFTVGDTFAKETIMAVYSDGNEVDVTSVATFSGYNMNTAGTQTVSVSYGGKSTSYQITVNAKIITLSSITVSEDHRIFSVGDTFVEETVTAHYSDGSRKTVTATFSNTYNMNVADTYTISVSYTEGGVTKDTSYTITVKSSGSGGGGASRTHTILASDAPNVYGTDTEKTVDDITYVFNQVGNSYTTGYMQCKKSASYICNKTVIAGLMSISINTSSKSWGGSVYYGTSEKPLANEATLSNGKYSIPSGNSYFNIVTNGSTGYIESIDIEYSTTPVNPTAISISGENELTPGSSTQLSLSFSPTNCNMKDVTWSSNNTSITVDQTGKVSVSSTAKVGATATITATSNEVGTVKGTFTITVVDQPVTPKDKWTILIYMCGSDLESGSKGGKGGYATSDITEILGVRNQPDDVNIAIQTGGANAWKKYSISSSNNQRYHVENRQLVKDNDQVYPEYQSMGESSTLKDFIQWGLETYPSEKTGLILWNHGGAMRGVCYDEKKGNDNLTNNEVQSAVSSALSATNTSGKLEFIGYDACLMGMQEVADFNAPYFNYMVCSQESEAGSGWDYDTWLDDLYSYKSTTTILKAICDGFISDNGGVNGRGNTWTSDYEGQPDYYEPANQTLSYLNLNYMDAYKQAFEAMAGQLKNKINAGNAKNFRNDIIGKTYCFSYDYDLDDPYLDYYGAIDVKHFLTVLKANSTFNPGDTYINNVLTAFNNLVEYSTSQQEGAHDANGLSCYFVGGTGYSNKDYCTSTFSSFTNWNYINSTYGGTVNYSYKY